MLSKSQICRYSQLFLWLKRIRLGYFILFQLHFKLFDRLYILMVNVQSHLIVCCFWNFGLVVLPLTGVSEQGLPRWIYKLYFELWLWCCCKLFLAVCEVLIPWYILGQYVMSEVLCRCWKPVENYQNYVSRVVVNVSLNPNWPGSSCKK